MQEQSMSTKKTSYLFYIKKIQICMHCLQSFETWEGRNSVADVASGAPGGGEIFRTRSDWSWSLFSLLYNWYWVFSAGKLAGRDVDHTRSIVIPVRPLYAFMAYSRGEFYS
jgi:hypothetical protein